VTGNPKVLRQVSKIQVMTVPSRVLSQPKCQVTISHPTLFFSPGPFFENYFHAMFEVIIPLMQVSRILAYIFVAEVCGTLENCPKPVYSITEIIYSWGQMSKELTGRYTNDVRLIAVDYCRKLKHYPFLLSLVSRYPVECVESGSGLCYQQATLGMTDILSVGLHDMNHIDEVFKPWRRHFYRVLNLTVDDPPRLPGRFNLGLCVRSNNRKLLNEDEVIQAVRKQFPKVNVYRINFSELNLTQAITVMRETDIFVGIHGAALANTIYLRPGSTMIQIYPYHENHYPMLIGNEFARMARLTHSFYIGHYESKLEHSTFRKANAGFLRRLRDPFFKMNLHKLHEQDITVPPADFLAMVGTAIGYMGSDDTTHKVTVVEKGRRIHEEVVI
jgi:hypothetical protein